jgi:serine/threonine protein kinase
MMLGRFELKRVLGEGAQATVWLGYDARLKREVAVKLMRADAAADPFAVNRWLQEARSVSRLTHPNIVPVFEADVHQQQPYLVFEYVPGPTLSEHVKVQGGIPRPPRPWRCYWACWTRSRRPTLRASCTGI